MMENMTTYFQVMLSNIAYFLGSEPIIYLFGLICLALLVKIMKDIIT